MIDYRRWMNIINDYRRRREICEANAASAKCRELADLWQTIAEAYAYLVELEMLTEMNSAALRLPENGDNYAPSSRSYSSFMVR